MEAVVCVYRPLDVDINDCNVTNKSYKNNGVCELRKIKKAGFISFVFIFFVTNVLVNMLPGIEPARAQSQNLAVTLHYDQEGIPGKSKTIRVDLKNNGADWIYNLQLEVDLDAGLDIQTSSELSDDAIAYSGIELVESGDKQHQVVTWHDFKDLAPAESYSFYFDVVLREDYRGTENEPTEFGDVLIGDITVSGSANPQTFDSNYVQQRSFSIELVPFEVYLEGGGHLLKGAGTYDHTDDDKFSELITVRILNNERYPLTINLSNEVANGVQVNADNMAFENMQLYSALTGLSTWDWNGVGLGLGETKTITYHTAIFDRLTEGGQFNSGAIIADGHDLPIKLAYSGIVNDQTYTGNRQTELIAKDIIIHKTVDYDGPFKYNLPLNYTLEVMVNEYHDMDSVTIVDTLGDGITFMNDYSIVMNSTPVAPGDFTFTATPEDGSSLDTTPSTELSWDFGSTLFNKLSNTVITYEAVSRSQWSNNEPIVAGDHLNNEVDINARNMTTGNGAHDGSAVTIRIDQPLIHKEVVNVNGFAPEYENGLVKVGVGDMVAFKVTYDPTALLVKQKDVQIVDIFPQGTIVDVNSITFNSAWENVWGDHGIDKDGIYSSTSNLTSDPNVLRWNFSEIPVGTGLIVVEYDAVVDEVPAVTNAKQAFNLAKAALQNSHGHVLSMRDQVGLIYAEPIITINKTAVGSTTDLLGGSEVSFEIELENTGLGDAFNIVVEDQFPPALDADSLANVTPGIDSQIDKPNNKVIFTVPTIRAGEKQTIAYTATIVAPTGSGLAFENNAVVTSYQDRATDSSRTYDENYAGFEPPQSSAELSMAKATLSKVVHSPANIDTVRVGDTVIYKITVDIPDGTITYDGEIIEQIPANQSLEAVYTDLGDKIGTSLTTTAGDEHNEVLFNTGNLAEGQHIFYVETIVEAIAGDNKDSDGKIDETQTNTAVFSWQDRAVDGETHRTSPASTSVTVKRPQLSTKLSTNTKEVVQNSEVEVQLTITNIGDNIAYQFTPSVTLPEGFSIVSKPGDAIYDTNTRLLTFAEVPSLSHENSSNKLTLTFTVELDELPGARDVFTFQGESGQYYPNETKDVDAAYLASTAQKQVAAPKLTINQQLDNNTNTGKSYVRQGDVVDIIIEVIARKGTQANNVVINDKFTDDYIIQKIINMQDDSEITGNNSNIATITIGPIDAEAEEQTLQYKVIAELNPDKDYTTRNDQVTGNDVELVWDTTQFTALKETANSWTYPLKHPELELKSLTPSASTFKDGVAEIIVTIPIENDSGTTAHDSTITYTVPPQLDVIAASDGGVSTNNEVVWEGLTIESGDTHELTVTLKLKADGSTPAGLRDLVNSAEINHYYSRATSEGTRKQYSSSQTESVNLHVDTIKVNKTLVNTSSTAWDPDNLENSYVRPGDTMEYNIEIIVPQRTTAYDAQLIEQLGEEQEFGGIIWQADEPVKTTTLSLGTLSGGSHHVTVMSIISLAEKYNEPEYTFTNTAEVKWAEHGGGTPSNGETSTIQGAVKQPSVDLTASATPTILSDGSQGSSVQVSINNSGTTRAYNVDVSVDVPAGFNVSDISADGELVTDPDTNQLQIKWIIDELAGEATAVLTFNVTQNDQTEANDHIVIPAHLNSYTNTEDKTTFKIYTKQTELVTIQTVGSHTLSPDSDQTVDKYAGEEHVFTHTLTNSGAGKDTYVITTTPGFPAVLTEDAEGSVELARDSDGSGSWDHGVTVEIELDRIESKTLYFKILVPETAPKGTISTKQLISTSTTDHADPVQQTAQVTDTIKVIGYDYNGVTFDGIAMPLDETDWQAGWSSTTVGAGSTIELAALTSRDITRVEAVIKVAGPGGGYIDNTHLAPIQLTQDGIGRWKATHTLSDTMATGSYYVEFISYNDTASSVQQDIESETERKIDNNMFRVDEPSLTIALNPSKTTVIANDQVAMTLGISNSGESTAHRFLPTVELPRGVQFVEQSVKLAGQVHDHYQYNAANHTVTFAVYEGERVTLETQQQLVFSFDVITNGDVSADERLNFHATTGVYYTAEEETAAGRTEKTTSAMLQSDTVKLIKTIASTTNDPESFVRPGDQIVYNLVIDIPDGVVVSGVELQHVLQPGSIIDAVEIDGIVTPVEHEQWSTTFAQLAQDQLVKLYTTATREHSGQVDSETNLTWQSQYRMQAGAPYKGHDSAAITTQVLEPALNIISFVGDKTQYTSSSDVITYTGKVTNSGDSTAYDTLLTVTVPAGLVPIDGSYSGGLYNEVNNTITWQIDTIHMGDDYDVSVQLGVRHDVPIATTGDISFAITTYYSTPLEAHRAQYVGGTTDAPYSLIGEHQLINATEKEAKAGETVTFHHIVQNTGAGSNAYSVDVTSPYAVVIKTKDAENNDVIIGEKDASGSWVSGPTPIHLHAGTNKPLMIDVIIPVEAPKTASGVPHHITVTVKDGHTDTAVNAQNKLHIAGETLDGWVSNALWSQWDRATYRDDWKEQTYYPGATTKFAAITSADAKAVNATIRHLNENGSLGAIIKTLTLEVVNPSTFVADRLKKWQHVAYALPTNIEAGRYFVQYEAELHTGAELDDTLTVLPSEAGYNNYFTVKTTLDLVGSVTEQRHPSKQVIDATVVLKQVDGTEVASTQTDASGAYRFQDVSLQSYILEVIPNEPYLNDYSKVIYVTPEHPAQTEVRVDVQLLDFIITIQANPSTIVGDGEDTTILTMTVISVDGTPAVGAEVELDAIAGTFMGIPGHEIEGNNKVTIGPDGSAQIVYRSEKIDGLVSQHIPVTITVNDPLRELYAEDTIYVIFAPGAIKGTVIDNETGLPVDQAVIVVYSDLDRGGDVVFYATQTTGPSGQYKIAIPQGEVLYTVEITKPVTIDGVTEYITFTQQSQPDIVDHTVVVEYPSVNTVTGIIFEKGSDATTKRFSEEAYNQIELTQLFTNGDGHLEELQSGLQGSLDPTTGIYTIEVPDKSSLANSSLTFGIVRVIPPSTTNPYERRLIVGKVNVTIHDDGDVIISNELIDPYGIITDSVTGDIIVDAEVKLYFADTERNKAKGNTPDTLVPLPLLDDFPPADNANPHRSDEYGNYAWMVFSESDYYIIADKPGYHQYRSPTISVEFEIVEHNFEMDPIQPASPFIPMPSPVQDEETVSNENIDLAVDISADQRAYMEHANITLTIDYTNRSDLDANDVMIVLDLPDHTTVVDKGGGELSESGDQLIWKVDVLPGGALKNIKAVLKANAITSSEQLMSAIVGITSSDELINLKDDVSKLSLMIFSNDYGTFEHVRYIQGYPDGEFKLNRNITRAEIATIFARILNLRPLVTNEVLYTDVPQHQWYADAVEAVTKRGLFTGYADGTFKPDQPITRAELTSVIFKFMGLEERPPVKANFLDLIGHWAADIIEDIHRNNIARGYADGSFKPDQYIVRSEAVTMINRLMYRGPLHGSAQSYPDVPQDHWAFGDVEESTRSHEASRNEDASEQLIRHIEATLDF